MGNKLAIKPLRLFDPSAKFVLSYEDDEGDYMIMGDVPWQ